MSTFRPFAYNTGSTISATTQVGDIAIGTNNLPVSDGYGGLQWNNGPDEDLGYVICYPQSGGTQPLPYSGDGFLQFWRSKIPGDDTSFINLAEYLSRKYSTPQVFANPTDAKIWLNANGFWTSYDSLPTPTATEVAATPTPTPTASEVLVTPTPTNTGTPTNTPTPSTSPLPVTGYSFNLVATPYNFPSSGNTIMNDPIGNVSGSTEINLLSTGGRGFYFNSFDTDGIDRTSYYSTFTGQSVTITFSQTGSTAIYSGDTDSFKQWVQSPTGSGFVFGTNIGVPPSGTPSGTAVLIQSATTNYTIGFPVYVSLVVN